MKARYIVIAVLLAVVISLIALNVQGFQCYLPKRPGQMGERLMLPPGTWCWPTDCYECIEYIVRPGDTLWKLARDLYPDRDIRMMVWAIRHANEMKTATILAWQTILVPDPESY